MVGLWDAAMEIKTYLKLWQFDRENKVIENMEALETPEKFFLLKFLGVFLLFDIVQSKIAHLDGCFRSLYLF